MGISIPIPTGTSGANAQSAVQQYNPSSNFAALNPSGQTKGGADVSALMDLQAAQSQYAGSPGDVSPTGFGGGMASSGSQDSSGFS